MNREGKIAVLTFALVLLASGWFVHFLGSESWNATSRFLLTYSLGTESSCRIDRLHQATGDKVFYEGHFFSDKAPGLSFAAVAPFLILRKLGVEGEAGMRYLLTLLTVGITGAIGAVIFWNLLGRLGWARGSWRLVLTLGWSLGSAAWPFATIFYGHQVAAVLLLSAFSLLAAGRRNGGVACWAGGGFLAGAAVTVEYPAALPAVILSLLAALSFSGGKKRWAWFAGLVLPLAALMLYNHHCFGSPLETGYAYHFTYDHSTGFFGIGLPSLKALYGITFSPYRGIFFSSPWLLAFVPGAWFLLRRRPRAEAACCLAIFGAHLVFNAGFAYWDGVGSFTARHLVGVLPFAALLAAGVRRPWRNAVAVLVLLSIAVMFVVTSTEPRAEWKVSSPLFYFNGFLFGQGLLCDNLGSLGLGWTGLWSLLPLAALLGLGLFLLGRLAGGFFPDPWIGATRRNALAATAAVAAWIILAGWEPPPLRQYDRTESLFRYWRSRGRVPWEELEARYLHISEADPGFKAPVERMAEINWGRGHPERAALCYRRLLELDPNDRNAALSLAATLAESGQPEPARKILLELVKKDPDAAEAYAQLALLAALVGNRSEGEEWLREMEIRWGDDKRMAQKIELLRKQLGKKAN